MGEQPPEGERVATEADDACSGRNRADLRRGYGRIEGGHALASRRRRGDCAPAYRNGPLVSRFRSSHHCAAHSFANFGIKGTLAIHDSSAVFGFEVPTQRAAIMIGTSNPPH